MREYRRQSRPRILVVDVGGTHVKLLVTGLKEPIEILSGPTLTAKAMIRKVKAALKDLPYEVVSIGYPGPVLHGRPLREPYNLRGGWVGFDFRKAFGRPVKIINDAAMQALGSYKGGRLLFLGLGTGLGSAMIVADAHAFSRSQALKNEASENHSRPSSPPSCQMLESLAQVFSVSGLRLPKMALTGDTIRHKLPSKRDRS